MGNRYKPLNYVLYVLLALFPIWLSAQSGPMVIDIIVKNASCAGYNDGKASASVTGGHPPYTYTWSNGQVGGVNNTGLSAGKYKVTVMDAPGNKVVKEFTVGQPESIRIRADLSSGTCGVNDNYAAIITGGTAPYTVSWKNVETGQVTSGANMVNPVKGSYIVEVTDANGCSGSKVVNYNGPFTVSVKTIDAVCGGSCDGSAEADVSGGTMPYTYKWNFKDMTSQNITPLPGGNYTVTVTDATGCQKVATGYVFEPAILEVNLTAKGTCSTTGSASINPTGGRPPYKITWSNGASGTSINNLTPGNYAVTVTDSWNCHSYANFTVNTNAALAPVLTKANPTCEGVKNGSITTSFNTDSGPYTFKWSNGATTQHLYGIGAGTYTLSVTDAAGCTGTVAMTLENQRALMLTTAETEAICGKGGTSSVVGIMGGVSPFTYQWSNGTKGQTVSGVGTYNVTVTDAEGCVGTNANPINVKNSNATNNLVVTPSITNASCGGVSNGAVSLNIGGGSGNYTYKWSNGATTQNLTGVPAAIYNVTVTDASGCETVSTLTVNNNYALTLLVNKTDAVCGVNGAATAVVSGGTAAVSYQWSNGQTSATASNLTPGSYNVTVTDTNGCSVSNTSNPVSIANIDNSNNLNIGATISDASCTGVNNGAISLSVSGAGTYTYKWSNGATTQNISGLPAGTYNVSVGEGSCETVKTFTINNQNTLGVTVNKTDISCDAVGAATAVVGGANGAVTYQWSSGQTTSSISNIPAGTYTVTVTDAVGCKASSVAATVLNNAKLTASLTKEDASCVGLSNGKVSAVVSCTPGTLNYRWSTGATSASIDNLPAGTYTVTVTASDGSTQVLTSVVNYTKTLALTTTSAPTLCGKTSGSASVLTATGGSEPYTYKWSNGASTSTAPNLGEGTYSVTVTDAQGCQIVSNNIAVAVQGSPISLVANPTNATCGAANGKVTLTAAGGSPVYTYKIGTTSNTTGVFEGLKEGSYTATVTDAAGCTSTQTVNVANSGNVQAAFNITPLSCEGNSPKYRFTNNSTGSTNGAKYDWTFSGNLKSSATNPEIAFNTSSGEAILTVTSAEGCTSTTRQSFPVDLIMVEAPNQVQTCQNTVTRVTVVNKTLFDYKYKWEPNNAIVSGGNTASPSINTANAGNTKLTVTVTNDFGCSLTKDVNLQVLEKNANSADPNKINIKQSCDSRKIEFTNTNPNSEYYRWVFGDPANPTAGSTEKNPSFTYSRTGNFTVTLVPTVPCLDTIKKTIPVADGIPVNVKANDDFTICKDSTIVLSANSPGNTLEWSTNPSFNPSTKANTFTVNPTLGVNKYYVRATNAQGCFGTDEIVITNGKIQLQVPNRTLDICKNAAGKQLNIVNVNNDGLTVTWSPSNVVSGQVLNPIVTSNSNVALKGDFKNAAGCTLSETFNVVTHEVDAKATINKTLVYPDEEVALTSTAGTGQYTYRWLSSTTTGTIVNPNTANTVARPKENTAYTVEITDQFGCKDTAIVRVVVLIPQCAEPDIFVPRAFTPDNGDELNDKVFVRGEFIEKLEFAIYNRWGELVFKTTNKEEGWDGKHKGAPVCPDVYGYYLKAICKDNQSFFKKGNITVLK